MCTSWYSLSPTNSWCCSTSVALIFPSYLLEVYAVLTSFLLFIIYSFLLLLGFLFFGICVNRNWAVNCQIVPVLLEKSAAQVKIVDISVSDSVAQVNLRQ